MKTILQLSTGVHMRTHRFSGVQARLLSIARAALLPAAVLLSAGALNGCVAEVEPATVPVGISYYDYPYTYYEGRTVYLVNGAWYYPSGNHWYRYRNAPVALEHRRGQLHYPPRYGHGGGPHDHRYDNRHDYRR